HLDRPRDHLWVDLLLGRHLPTLVRDRGSNGRIRRSRGILLAPSTCPWREGGAGSRVERVDLRRSALTRHARIALRDGLKCSGERGEVAGLRAVGALPSLVDALRLLEQVGGDLRDGVTVVGRTGCGRALPGLLGGLLLLARCVVGRVGADGGGQQGPPTQSPISSIWHASCITRPPTFRSYSFRYALATLRLVASYFRPTGLVFSSV